MMGKKRNFVTQKVIPESRKAVQVRIENEEINALHIKFEAYNHFLAMVTQNHQTLVSDYSRKLLEQHELLRDLAGAKKQNVDDSISEIHNSMFMLRIQNQKLKCKEKLLRQKLQCQKVLYRQRKQQGTQAEKERRMRIEQIKLLKEEVQVLQSIVEKKKNLKQTQQKKQQILSVIPRIRQIIQQGDAESMEPKLRQVMQSLQVRI